MNDKLVYGNQMNQSDETLKTTSLLYFQDALISEQYENAAELLASARNLGASEDEIQVVIAEVILKMNGKVQLQGAELDANRLQYVKEED